ncbi:MAG: hypothetical protein V4732_18815 [Pseudomonadota bacterium]
MEHYFDNCKAFGHFLIDKTVEGLSRCTDNYPREYDKYYVRPAVYISDPETYSTLLGRPFVLACSPYVGSLVCRAHYRLFPSLDIDYGYHEKDIDSKEIVKFDKYIRQLFEAMHVPNKPETKAN